jgi:hypothetical protein
LREQARGSERVHDGFHEEFAGETPVFGRSSNGGFWPKKVKNALSFNGD